VSGSRALPPRWPPQCSCVVIESSFDSGERLQAPGSLWCVITADDVFNEKVQKEEEKKRKLQEKELRKVEREKKKLLKEASRKRKQSKKTKQKKVA
jgi:hypothetical protein